MTVFLEIFLTFFKVGMFTIGGGYAMLPFIQSEVLSHGWMSGEAIINFIAVSESTPGPFAINIATYVGSVVGGEFGAWGSLLGSFCATLGTVLPSFIIILLVAKIFDKFKENRFVKGAMTGLRPTVVGLISAAIFSMLMTVFFPVGLTIEVRRQASLYISLAICTLMTFLAFKKVHPIIIICTSALIGIAAGYLLGLPV